MYIVRCIWWVVGMCTLDSCGVANHLIDRVIICLFLFIWNCMLLYWIDAAHNTKSMFHAEEAVNGNVAFKPRIKGTKILFYVITGLIIFVTLFFAICGVIYHKGLPKIDLYYKINMLLICLMHFVYMVGIAIYGTILFYRLYKSGRSHFAFIIRIEVFILTVLICLSFRIVAFILYSLFNEKINVTLAFIFGNEVPEIIPTLSCIWLFNSKFIKQNYLQGDPGQALIS